MKKKSRLSKKKLKGALLEIIRQSPGKKFNYKQLSKSLRIKKLEKDYSLPKHYMS